MVLLGSCSEAQHETQLTFVVCEFNGKRRKTCNELFLVRMDALLPWVMMLAVIVEPVYPKADNLYRSYSFGIVLCIYCWR